MCGSHCSNGFPSNLKGFTGRKGLIGNKGQTGSKGEKGDKGIKGEDGIDGTLINKYCGTYSAHGPLKELHIRD